MNTNYSFNMSKENHVPVANNKDLLMTKLTSNRIIDQEKVNENISKER